MSNCPFWSTSREKVSCYGGCPMQASAKGEEGCPFKELVPSGKSIYTDMGNEDLFYSQDRYLNYEVSERIVNY